jgi:tRNA(Ile)-lysidine synthase
VEVALSGGADSLALAACLSFIAPKAGWMAGAVVVDHGLQPDSGDVAARAAEQATTLGLDAEVVIVEVGTDGGPEAAARDARHAALRARPVDAVLLGHTLDDQAETVLLGLARGSGPRSIAGMPAVGFDGFIRRPFLGLRRTDTERICTATGLDWWTDPHNHDASFLRSRVRHELMPQLEDVLGGGVAEALARTADQVRDDLAVLDELADEVPDPCDVAVLAALPTALRRRALRLAALGAGADRSELSSVHISELDRLVTDWHGQVRVELPGQVSASRVGAVLRFGTTPVAG